MGVIGQVAGNVAGVAVGLYFLLAAVMLCRAAAHLGEVGMRRLDPRDRVDAAIVEASELDREGRVSGLAVTPRRVSEDVRPGQRLALLSGALVEHGGLVTFGVLLERDAVN